MSEYKDETNRGYQEASRQFEMLRQKWSAAFPTKSHQVRPLVTSATETLVDTFGWSKAYARAILRAWKFRRAYCRAVLVYPRQINLDGSDSGVEVDDAARTEAREQLARIEAKRNEPSGTRAGQAVASTAAP